ncbi:hypothetical protein [Streptomyces sp. NBC_01304]|uniref:hypothetical protein n=1 Tax=Streptomyces sp. NBC_01304 TaxID=2903818 RepID=UPI002E1041EB|nr:hypothetical protein OG430_44930 [Streptomyces sp. NBC_01304]
MSDVYLTRYVCPVCQGCPQEADCHHCAHTGVTDDIRGWENLAVPLPRPPAVMRSPCSDCAFREGSPEQEHDYELSGLRTGERVFYCHHGMNIINGAYQPTATLDGVPVGYLVCAGWWAHITGNQGPQAPYRESPADRQTDK